MFCLPANVNILGQEKKAPDLAFPACLVETRKEYEGAVLPLQQTRKTLYVTMMPPTQISLCLILLSHGATPQNFVVRALGEDGSSTGNEVISISVQNNNTLNSVGDVNIDPGLIEDELVCNITQQGGPAGPGRDCKLPFTFNGVVSGAK